jgi:hypothetical protein
MTGLKSYSTTPASNSELFPEDMAPSVVNNSARQVQADLASWYHDAEWIEYGAGTGDGGGGTDYVASYVSSGSFAIVGADVRSAYVANRRVRATVNAGAYIYGSIASASYAAGDTTVTVTWDSTSLSSGTIRVWLGIVSSPTSLPVSLGVGQIGSGDPNTLLGWDDNGDPTAYAAGAGITIDGGAGTISAPVVGGVGTLTLEVSTIGTSGSATLGASDVQLRISGTTLYRRILRVRNNTPASAVTVTVPDISTITPAGAVFEVQVASDQTGTVTIQRATNGTINGATSIVAQGAGATVILAVESNGGTAPVVRAYGDTTEAKTIAGAITMTGSLHLGTITDVEAAILASSTLSANLSAIAGLTTAADKLTYWTGSGTAALTTLSSFIRTVLDDADAATARGTLGLGSIATQAASAVAITGGTMAGVTVTGGSVSALAADLPIADGGTGASTANLARNGINKGTVALTDAASIATDCSLGNVFTVTLGGNRTLANPTNLAAGASYTWIIKQDATGLRTLAYGTNFDFGTAGTPTLTGTANKVDVISAYSPDGTKVYASINKGFS